MPVVVTAVSHHFAGQNSLLRDVSFRVETGELLGITGASGSGKSTLLAMIAGWLDPRAGTVERLGVRQLTWVPQNPYGVARRSAVDHVMLPMLTRRSRKAALPVALGLLGTFGIRDVAGREFRRLSGGEAQRLMLARAVASEADLILVDEPTAQLDPHSAAAVIAVLGGLASGGATVIIATHDPRVAQACGNTLALGGS